LAHSFCDGIAPLVRAKIEVYTHNGTNLTTLKIITSLTQAVQRDVQQHFAIGRNDWNTIASAHAGHGAGRAAAGFPQHRDVAAGALLVKVAERRATLLGLNPPIGHAVAVIQQPTEQPNSTDRILAVLDRIASQAKTDEPEDPEALH
jgi:hypothetical protein